MSLAIWLHAGRVNRGMSIEDVARVTKIQQRILERIEAGRFEGLPADVFVRGFVRNFARSVGLDEAEALRRYTAIGTQSGPVASPAARALVETMSELAPGAAGGIRDAAIGPVVLKELAVISIGGVGGLGDAPRAEGSVRMNAIASEPIALGQIIETAPPVAVAPVVADVVVEPLAVEAVVAAPAIEELVAPVAAEAVEIDVAAIEVVAPAPKKSRRKSATGAPAKPRSRRKSATTSETAVVVAAQLDIASDALAIEAVAAVAPVAPVAIEAAVIDAAVIDAPVVDAPAPSVALDAATDVAPTELAAEPTELAASSAIEVVDLSADATLVASDSAAVDATPVEPAAIWAPRMPTAAPTSTPPWRRPSFAAAAPIVPSLVIDDSDPDSAERELEDRRAERAHGPTRRSFLPPILLDREDRSARQGGLTLAVIILLIAATLTLSYLMRRPSSSGDGMTQADRPAPTQLV